MNSPKLGEFREVAPEEINSMIDVPDNIQYQSVSPEQVNPVGNTVAAVTPPPMDISELHGAETTGVNADRVDNQARNFADKADSDVTNVNNVPVESQGIDLSLVSEGLLGMGKTRIVVISPDGDNGSLTTWLLARKLAAKEKHVVIMDMTGSGVTNTTYAGLKFGRGCWRFSCRCS